MVSSAPIPRAEVWPCSCACHDGGMCGFASCYCGHPGRPRVLYPDRPPPAASSPFRWYWSEQARPRPYALLGEPVLAIGACVGHAAGPEGEPVLAIGACVGHAAGLLRVEFD